VCSGIEAATVAWHPLGWKAVAYSEIEPFPSAVLAHHYPDVPNVGDMTKYKEWDLGAVDLLVGGTPCQSFSVAGLRKGLADPRGNLALVYCGILDHFKPRWFVWENVPGVLSSGGGRDFGSFLGAVAELGYGFAYRVLDAQFFGVAQRRRRVFVVGYLGDWRPAAKVLFERESLRGDPAPSRKKGEVSAARTGFSVTGSVTGGFGPRLGTDESCQGSVISQPYPIANTLTARMAKGINSTVDEGQTPVIQPVAVDTYNGTITGDIAATLSTRSGVPDATGPSVMTPVGFTRCDHGGDAVIDGTPTMRCGSNYSAHLAVAFHPTQDPISSAEVCHSIGANENATAAVATGVFFAGQGAKAGSIAYDQHIAPTLKASDSGTNRTPSAHIGMQVRRLTPVECERLQGFPDNYTAIPWRKKPTEDCPDGPRYKALGNSMAVPVMAWIGKRIANAA
jgi:DNA (cytosine-5)-methyltransferase 1